MPPNRNRSVFHGALTALTAASAILIPVVGQASATNHDAQRIYLHAPCGSKHDHAVGPLAMADPSDDQTAD